MAQNWTLNAASGMAFATSLIFLSRLRRNKDRSSTPVALLALGLFLWFIAEIVWTYHVYFLEVELPYPSLADVFYIAAYLPVGYSLHKLSKTSSAVHQENKIVITAIAVTVTAFITNVFLFQIVDSAIGFTELSQDDLLLLGISVAYPLLDAYLLIPSIIILYSLRKSKEHLTWTLLAASMLVMAAADTGFGYAALVEIEALSSEVIWDVLYVISYMLLATSMVNGLLAHRRQRTEIAVQELN